MRIKVQKSQLYYHEDKATEIESVQCAKELDLGTDAEEDIDVTCLDDEEDNFDPGKKHRVKVLCQSILMMKMHHILS